MVGWANGSAKSSVVRCIVSSIVKERLMVNSYRWRRKICLGMGLMSETDYEKIIGEVFFSEI